MGNTDLNARIDAALNPTLAALGVTIGPKTRELLRGEGVTLDMRLARDGTWIIGMTDYEPKPAQERVKAQRFDTTSLQTALDRLEERLTPTTLEYLTALKADNASELGFANGSRIISFPAKAVRGYSNPDAQD